MIARKVIKRLQEESPEVFAEKKAESDVEVDLNKVDAMTPPSELKKMSEAIARKRLAAPGLSEEETSALMRRIGH